MKRLTLRGPNGGLRPEQYKSTVYTKSAHHGAWYFDRISRLLSVKVRTNERILVKTLDFVRVSLTVAVTEKQFFDSQTNFIKYVASALMINPARVRVIDVVPGNGRRQLGETGSTSKVDR